MDKICRQLTIFPNEVKYMLVLLKDSQVVWKGSFSFEAKLFRLFAAKTSRGHWLTVIFHPPSNHDVVLSTDLILHGCFSDSCWKLCSVLATVMNIIRRMLTATKMFEYGAADLSEPSETIKTQGERPFSI